jgi:tRNA nucleotidyltransferase (CCA-adding enzyme)
MMRAIRFANQLNFEIENSSLESITKNAERIKIISGERIVDELNKILSTDKPSVGFLLLYKTGLLDILLPELTLNQVKKSKVKPTKTILPHTRSRRQYLSKYGRCLRWAALLHDIGKHQPNVSTKTRMDFSWT